MFHANPTTSAPLEKCAGCDGEAEVSVWGFRVCYPCTSRLRSEANARKVWAGIEVKAIAAELFGKAVRR
jgi:hypothetical protein